MNNPTLRQKLDELMSKTERPATLGWANFFQWLGQQTATPRTRGASSKLIQE